MLADASAAPPQAGLDLHEELSTLDPQNGRLECTCRPNLRLRSEHGELVHPRGKLVNSCDYCAKLQAVENAEMLALDALEGDPPQLWAVLTTRTATIDMAPFYRALEYVKRGLRKRWPDAEYSALLEFTTGYGPRSGGKRRPHWNLLIKGVPAAALEEAQAVVVASWCRNVDALPAGQYVDCIGDGVALLKYVALHFQKASQKPPPGFTGQRFNCSRGYFTGCTRATARARARESLRLKRELWKHALVLDDAHEIELAAQLAHRRNAQTRWTLCTASGARHAPTRVGDELHDRLRAGVP